MSKLRRMICLSNLQVAYSLLVFVYWTNILAVITTIYLIASASLNSGGKSLGDCTNQASNGYYQLLQGNYCFRGASIYAFSAGPAISFIGVLGSKLAFVSIEPRTNQEPLWY